MVEPSEVRKPGAPRVNGVKSRYRAREQAGACCSCDASARSAERGVERLRMAVSTMRIKRGR